MRCMSTVTSVDSPSEVSAAFVVAINAGDLPGALRLYHNDAALLAPDGQCARGIQAIEGLLRGLLAMHVEMDNVIEVGGIAVASEAWTMRLRLPEGTSDEQHGQSIVLFTQTPDGWRFLIDAPWGLSRQP
jgi:ketosteroid isomerase-like protein